MPTLWGRITGPDGSGPGKGYYVHLSAPVATFNDDERTEIASIARAWVDATTGVYTFDGVIPSPANTMYLIKESEQVTIGVVCPADDAPSDDDHQIPDSDPVAYGWWVGEDGVLAAALPDFTTPVVLVVGPTGAKGNTGDTGPAPTITVDAVNELASNATPTFVLSGASPDYHLTVGLPQGLKGDPGAAPTITVDSVTALAPGSAPTFVISGTSPALHVAVGIPTGATGAQGPQGVFTGSETEQNLGNVTGAINVDLSAGSVVLLTLIGNTTITFVNAQAGKASAVLLIVSQDATGARTLAITNQVNPFGASGQSTLANLSQAPSVTDWVSCQSVDAVHWLPLIVAQQVA